MAIGKISEYFLEISLSETYRELFLDDEMYEKSFFPNFLLESLIEVVFFSEDLETLASSNK